MTNLTRASKQLFLRPDDERFESFDSLLTACEKRRDESDAAWKVPGELEPISLPWGVAIEADSSGRSLNLNDWSFSQVCQLSRVQKETVNRLSPDTATAVFKETFPGGTKPMQLLTRGDQLRSIHGASYTRLFDVDLLEMVQETADNFTPPPVGMNGGTGLYSGEQDTFAFLIDDSAWVEIDGEDFAPGFFVWNSEVGRRSVGMETFWFQRICQNHIDWGANEVVTYSRKHTANVGAALTEIQQVLQQLIGTRNERRDAFAKTIKSAMDLRIGDDAEEAAKTLSKQGIPIGFVKEAVKETSEKGSPFTLFGMDDSLTRLTGRMKFAGDRSDQDRKIGSLLSLAS
ncbi:DUF932 domain-containing protein [Rhodopirellula europaea]|uniref:DUF932 domain-containing protein n=1 Tax=Rhodopirellula europaea TaxID=1263866 RepID=UPI0030EDB5DB